MSFFHEDRSPSSRPGLQTINNLCQKWHRKSCNTLCETGKQVVRVVCPLMEKERKKCVWGGRWIGIHRQWKSMLYNLFLVFSLAAACHHTHCQSQPCHNTFHICSISFLGVCYASATLLDCVLEQNMWQSESDLELFLYNLPKQASGKSGLKACSIT